MADDRDPLFPLFPLGSPEASAARVAAIGQRAYNPARPNAASPVPNWDAGLSAPTGVINTSIGASGAPLPPPTQADLDRVQLAATSSGIGRAPAPRRPPPSYQDNPFLVLDEPDAPPSLDMELFAQPREDFGVYEPPEEPVQDNPFRARTTRAPPMDSIEFDDLGTEPQAAPMQRAASQELPTVRRGSSPSGNQPSRGRIPRMQRASANFGDVMASIDARLFGGEG